MMNPAFGRLFQQDAVSNLCKTGVKSRFMGLRPLVSISTKAVVCRIACSAVVGATIISPVSAADCGITNQPSYTATRITTIGAAKITSKIFVSGKNIREEVRRGNDTEIILRSPKGVIMYSKNRKQGVRLGAPRPRGKKNRNSGKIERIKVGKNTKIVYMLQGQNGKWFEDFSEVCSKSGILIKRDFRTLIKGKAVPSSIRQNGIKRKKFPNSLFRVPKNVRLNKG